MGKTPGCSGDRRQEQEGGLNHGLIGVVVGKARQSWGNSLGLTSWEDFSGLWAIEVVSSCLVPGPRMIKAKEYCLPEWMGQVEAVWLWIGEFVYQRYSSYEYFAIPKNWLALRGAFSSQPERFFKMSKHNNIQNKLYIKYFYICIYIFRLLLNHCRSISGNVHNNPESGSPTSYPLVGNDAMYLYK